LASILTAVAFEALWF